MRKKKRYWFVICSYKKIPNATISFCTVNNFSDLVLFSSGIEGDCSIFKKLSTAQKALVNTRAYAAKNGFNWFKQKTYEIKSFII